MYRSSVHPVRHRFFFFLLGWRLFLYSWENKIFRIYSIGCYSGIQLLKKYSMAFYSFCIKYSFVFTRFPQITRSWFTCFFKKSRVTRFILVFTYFLYFSKHLAVRSNLLSTICTICSIVLSSSEYYSFWTYSLKKNTRLNFTRSGFLLDRNYSIREILLGFGYSIS